MSTLYMDQQGSKLCKSGRQLLLHGQDDEVHRFPLEQVERVMVYGQVQITTAALGALLERGICVTMLTQRGWLHGHVVGECGGQVQRRARQYELMVNAERAFMSR